MVKVIRKNCVCTFMYKLQKLTLSNIASRHVIEGINILSCVNKKTIFQNNNEEIGYVAY